MSGSAAVVVLAASVWAAAWLALPVPGIAVVVAVLAAILVRRPWLVVIAAVILASWLGAGARAGIDPLEARPWAGPVTLVSDPDDAFGAVRAVVRAGGRHHELWARGAGAVELRDRLAGERLVVRGRLEPLPEGSWLRHRHVVGRLVADHVSFVDAGSPPARVANALRRTVTRGARTLPIEQRALYTGFVFGDDRGQPAAVADDFRASGLSHLLAVSGQNVAFVLALVAPLGARLGLRGRFALTVAVLAFFALVTRFEPSVLRATGMAALAALSVTVGRPVPALRLLALAVTALVLVDPFLVHSLGFVLSVGASLGITLLARPLGETLPGPRALRSAFAVTLAAQAGVAPVLIPVFGGVPVASLPANLLAGPLAGTVTVWGLTAGPVAGFAPDPLAAGLLVPVRLALGWIAWVARATAGWPLGELDGPTAGALAVALVLVVVARRRGRRLLVRLASLAAVVTLCIPALVARGPVPVRAELAEVGTLWRVPHATGRFDLLVLDGTATAGRALESLRRSGVTRLDLVVSSSGGSRAATTLHQVASRVAVDQVWAPSAHRVGRATTPAPGRYDAPGGVRLVVRAVSPRLVVEVTV